ncbi:Rieske (2Fe-2S) protein [Halomonas sp. V046]|uniref:Rieske (2Fe-2S) protein n=1 Tax=Halomonas sp. V046 TaxID=3459611 RepID=UPI004044545A
MTDAWRSYKSAPPAGTRVVPADALIPGASHCTTVVTENGRFPLVLVRSDADILHAYVNACPHQYLPLDSRGSNILSRDGGLLICSAHQATFRTDTGEGVSGPGQGEALDPVPLVEVEGWWVIGE